MLGHAHVHEVFNVCDVGELPRALRLRAHDLVRTALALHRRLACGALRVARQLLDGAVHAKLAPRRKGGLAAACAAVTSGAGKAAADWETLAMIRVGAHVPWLTRRWRSAKWALASADMQCKRKTEAGGARAPDAAVGGLVELARHLLQLRVRARRVHDPADRRYRRLRRRRRVHCEACLALEAHIVHALPLFLLRTVRDGACMRATTAQPCAFATLLAGAGAGAGHMLSRTSSRSVLRGGIWQGCGDRGRGVYVQRRTSSLQCVCQASAAHSRHSVLPVPVGLSSKAFLRCTYTT